MYWTASGAHQDILVHTVRIPENERKVWSGALREKPPGAAVTSAGTAARGGGGEPSNKRLKMSK